MKWSAITQDEEKFLRFLMEVHEPHKQLNIPQLLRDRK